MRLAGLIRRLKLRGLAPRVSLSRVIVGATRVGEPTLRLAKCLRRFTGRQMRVVKCMRCACLVRLDSRRQGFGCREFVSDGVPYMVFDAVAEPSRSVVSLTIGCGIPAFIARHAASDFVTRVVH